MAPSGARDSSGQGAAVIAWGAVGAVAAAVLLALPALWYIGGASSSPGRYDNALAELTELGALDARWEREAMGALNDITPDAARARAATPPAAVTKRLEAIAQEIESPVLQRGAEQLARAFSERAALAASFEKAHAASRAALRDILAMEAEMSGVLREAWRDAPDRQRLIAADNVITQLLADAQRYYYAPAESGRRNLEASTADLRGAAEAVPALNPAAARLDRHVAELLRARSQEQTYFDRVRFRSAGPLIAALAHDLRHERDLHRLRWERYRAYLASGLCALLVLVAYLAARIVRRELARRPPVDPLPAKPDEEGLPAEPTLARPPEAPPKD
jgi:hypothetical protein